MDFRVPLEVVFGADVRCNFKERFFPQKSFQGFDFMPKASQSDPKIDEKSNPEPDFPYFGETLIFDDSTMVLLDFSGPDKL